MKASFGASTLVDDGDFFYFLADSMAEGIKGFYFIYLGVFIILMNYLLYLFNI